MPLTKAALMCLESSAYMKTDLIMARYIRASIRKGKPRQFTVKYKLLRENPDAFFLAVNVSVETFDYILEHVKEDLKQTRRCSVERMPEEKLFITLQYLATGMPMRKLASTFQIASTTATRIIFATMDAIWKRLSPTHLRDPTHAEMNELAKEYFDRWKFPNCVGAIGGKHVRVFNSAMGTFKRVIVNAVVDVNFRFLNAHVVRKRNSEDTFVKKVFKITGMQCLPGTEVMLPLVIIGNEAYPLKSNLMKPYPSRAAAACEDKEIFNDRLKHARVPVDCAFEILTEKWKIYTRPFALSVADTREVVKVTCLLHNIIKDREGDKDPHFSKFGQVDNGIIYLNLVTHKSRRNNRASSIAISIRDQMKEYIRNMVNVPVCKPLPAFDNFEVNQEK